MRLVVYGSFNCPYSLLASRRVDRLIDLGIADVEWRAVVHDPDIPLRRGRSDGSHDRVPLASRAGRGHRGGARPRRAHRSGGKGPPTARMPSLSRILGKP
jgi:hypothetical protein